MKEKCNNCWKEASHFDVNLKSWVCDKCIENFYENINLDEFRKEFGDARYKEEIRGMIQEEEAKEIGIEIIENYIVNLPIWTNKGRSIEEIRNASK